ncbi:MAG: hypothetical protein ACK4G4_12285, partial [Thermus sp.]|uniref:hypothetical protein n=1 Tax=Thermus sp. TaxID=275 RepID=UPI00391963B1
MYRQLFYKTTPLGKGRRLAQAQERAVKAAGGLVAELGGKGVLAVLPGSTATLLSLVATGHGGHPVTAISGSS